MMLNTYIRVNGIRRIRNELYQKVQSLSLNWHRRRSQGDTLYRILWENVKPREGFYQIEQMLV
jgi:ABC-type multidrug transport system fused ATPase/permease subunit